MSPFRPVTLVLPLVAVLGVVAHAARGEVSEPGSLYPLTARLELFSEARNACLVRDGDAQHPGCRVAVGERLHQAYDKVLRRMFRAPPTEVPADLEIAISLAHSDIIEGIERT